MNISSPITAPITAFQSKIADLMILLGSGQRQQILEGLGRACLGGEVLMGEEGYLGRLRGRLVERGYVGVGGEGGEEGIGSFGMENKQQQQQLKNIKIQQPQQPKPTQKQKTPKKGTKTYKKQTKQRFQNLRNKLLEDKFHNQLQYVFSSQDKQNLTTNFTLCHKIVEVKLSVFFYVRWFIDQNYGRGRINLEEIFQCIRILIKVIQLFKGFKGKALTLQFTQQQQPKHTPTQTQISHTLILDLQQTLHHLIQHYKYSNLQVIYNYPRLIFDNRYHKYFPCFDNKPYKTQFQLIQCVRGAIEGQWGEKKGVKSTFLLYNTMVGTGKSSTVLALLKLVQSVNSKYQKGKQKVYFIYSCQISSIRTEIAKICYNKKINIGLAKEKIIKRGQKFCSYIQIERIFNNKQEQINLIITDWKIAHKIINKRFYTEQQLQLYENQHISSKKLFEIASIQPQNTVLFIDQPTIHCQKDNYYKTSQLFQILAHPPKVLILASATLPRMQQIPKTIQLYSTFYPNRVLRQIRSKQFHIGCQMKRFNGQLYYPHKGVRNRQQLLNVIKKIEEIPFLMRMYTQRTLFLLINLFESKGIKIPKDMHYDQIKTNIHCQTFEKSPTKILNLLLNQDEDLISQICQEKINSQQIQDILQRKQSSDEEFFDSLYKKKVPQNKINFRAMIREDAYKFLGGCLICTQNPYQFVKQHFQSWIKDIPSIKSLSHSHFPAKKRINSLQHYRLYNRQVSQDEQRIHLSKLIAHSSIKQVVEDQQFKMDKNLMKFLLCGIGIYTQKLLQKNVDRQYLRKVEHMAAMGQLSFIVCDQSLCYGVNFPISNIILCDDLAENLTFNEIFQLTGRAGRVGRSWIADIYFQENTERRFIQFMLDQYGKIGYQGDIFEEFAQEYLCKGNLRLRTKYSEIMYDSCDKDAKIELAVRKYQQELEKQTFTEEDDIQKRKIIINRQQLLQNNLHWKAIKISKIKIHLVINYSNQQTNQFDLQTQLEYQDIPKIGQINNKEEQCEIQNIQENHNINNPIDFKYYYQNQQQFINKTIQNSIKRSITHNSTLPLSKISKIAIKNSIKLHEHQLPVQKLEQKQVINEKQSQFWFVLVCVDTDAELLMGNMVSVELDGKQE